MCCSNCYDAVRIRIICAFYISPLSKIIFFRIVWTDVRRVRNLSVNNSLFQSHHLHEEGVKAPDATHRQWPPGGIEQMFTYHLSARNTFHRLHLIGQNISLVGSDLTLESKTAAMTGQLSCQIKGPYLSNILSKLNYSAENTRVPCTRHYKWKRTVFSEGQLRFATTHYTAEQLKIKHCIGILENTVACTCN